MWLPVGRESTFSTVPSSEPKNRTVLFRKGPAEASTARRVSRYLRGKGERGKGNNVTITKDLEDKGCRRDPLLPAGGLGEPGLLGHGFHGFVQERVGLDEAQRGIRKLAGGSVPRGLAHPSAAARPAEGETPQK